MPQAIPYDPALALTEIIDTRILDALEKVAAAREPANAAEEAYNAALFNFQSIELTLNELGELGIDTDSILKELEVARKAVTDSANHLAATRISSLKNTANAKTEARKILASLKDYPESPLDLGRIQFKSMPISADSIQMDVQYFSADVMSQRSRSLASSVKGYVSSKTIFLGDHLSTLASNAAQSQTSQQTEEHDIEGTLVFSMACTHKNAVLVEPCVLDVDKAARVWNGLGLKPALDPTKKTEMLKASQRSPSNKDDGFYVLSGATYGSCFIGMVHVIRQSDTAAEQRMKSAVSSLQAQMKIGGWFIEHEGGFGVSKSFSEDAKDMLSTQQITSHANAIVMGSIPNISSNEVRIGVKEFADFDPAKMMEKLATLQNATARDHDSVESSANAARTGGEMMAIRATEIKSVMSGLTEVDDGRNKIININSLMTAFDDYVAKAIEGKIGTPVTFYLKHITGAQIAQEWMKKYFGSPNLEDESKDSGPATSKDSGPAKGNDEGSGAASDASSSDGGKGNASDGGTSATDAGDNATKA